MSIFQGRNTTISMSIAGNSVTNIGAVIDAGNAPVSISGGSNITLVWSSLARR